MNIQHEIVFAEGTPPCEDRALFMATENGTIVLVADGAGGTGEGQKAVTALAAEVTAQANSLSGPSPIVRFLLDLDATLHRSASGETTAVLLLVDEDGISGASVGDSQAWLLRDGEPPTELTHAQERKPLVGSGRCWPVAFGPVTSSGSRLLAGSDGLFNYVPFNKIFRLAQDAPLPEAASSLLEAARLPSGSFQDDIVALIAEFPK